VFFSSRETAADIVRTASSLFKRGKRMRREWQNGKEENVCCLALIELESLM
jgi:hypothetical protein